MQSAGSVERRVRLAPEQRRAQLIALGVEMLATRTLDELSVEEIAAQAGISRGLLFHYFASKQEFHTAVAQAAADELLERTEPDSSLPALDALRAALGAFVDYVADNPDSYLSLVRGAASGDAGLRAIFDRTRARMAGRVITVLAETGVPLTPTAELAVHGWVAFVEECVVRSIADGVELAAEAGPARGELLDLLANALPALVAVSGGAEAALAGLFGTAAER